MLYTLFEVKAAALAGGQVVVVVAARVLARRWWWVSHRSCGGWRGGGLPVHRLNVQVHVCKLISDLDT
jgi:hypothetical protein